MSSHALSLAHRRELALIPVLIGGQLTICPWRAFGLVWSPCSLGITLRCISLPRLLLAVTNSEPPGLVWSSRRLASANTKASASTPSGWFVAQMLPTMPCGSESTKGWLSKNTKPAAAASRLPHSCVSGSLAPLCPKCAHAKPALLAGRFGRGHTGQRISPSITKSGTTFPSSPRLRVLMILSPFFLADAAANVLSSLATPWQQFDVEHVSFLGYIRSQGPVLVSTTSGARPAACFRVRTRIDSSWRLAARLTVCHKKVKRTPVDATR